MTLRLAAAVLLGSAFVTLPFASAETAPPPTTVDTSKLPRGKDAWDIRRMDEEPVKLVKVTYDRDANEARFVLEFTRDLYVRDTDWGGVRPEPPFRFDFEDEDGVTLVSLAARYDGVPIGLKG